MADGAGREPSWIRENGGVVAIVATIIAVGALIYQGDRRTAAHIASLQTEIGNRITDLRTDLRSDITRLKDRVEDHDHEVKVILYSMGGIDPTRETLPSKGSESGIDPVH